MDREEPDSIGRLTAIQRHPRLYDMTERYDAIIEAIRDLDSRFRTHAHTKDSP